MTLSKLHGQKQDDFEYLYGQKEDDCEYTVRTETR